MGVTFAVAVTVPFSVFFLLVGGLMGVFMLVVMSMAVVMPMAVLLRFFGGLGPMVVLVFLVIPMAVLRTRPVNVALVLLHTGFSSLHTGICRHLRCFLRISAVVTVVAGVMAVLVF